VKKIGQGRENAKIYLEQNPKIADEIEKVIRDQAAAITKALDGNPVPKESEKAVGKTEEKEEKKETTEKEIK
jgi:recombination protein RecA